ncbi:MAG: 5'/3'-nucleotidase SurE, partial [Gemmatimonadetes bacterium]|nr:5'/3'-nucleotidase SurE [Gemmatimonadota bacterium]
MRFICTNDDGIHARGLRVLCEAAGRLGEVFVVAPDRQRSASSHSLTLHRPLRVTEVDVRRVAVDGTPTDCVLLAVKELCERKPDFVLSGVNH